MSFFDDDVVPSAHDDCKGYSGGVVVGRGGQDSVVGRRCPSSLLAPYPPPPPLTPLSPPTVRNGPGHGAREVAGGDQVQELRLRAQLP